MPRWKRCRIDYLNSGRVRAYFSKMPLKHDLLADGSNIGQIAADDIRLSLKDDASYKTSNVFL